MRRALIPLLCLLVALGCTTTRYIKFPAEQYLDDWLAERLEIQDRTHAARQKCDAVHVALLAPGTNVPVVTPTPANVDKVVRECDRMASYMKRVGAKDYAVLRASLKGDTMDPEQLAAFREVIGPLFDVAKLIVAL